MPAVATYTATGVNLDQYAGRLKNLAPALDTIGAYTERLAKESIIKGETMGGKPLAPLAPSTVAEKKLRGKARGILRRDGALLASISFVRTSGKEVQVGTNLQYAPWVILGTSPYTIRAKTGRGLRFYTADGWRNTMQVNHPGLPERNIFDGFQKRVAPFVEATLASYLETGKP
jgi:hypothetical protein